jgi:hypothetical protein
VRVTAWKTFCFSTKGNASRLNMTPNAHVPQVYRSARRTVVLCSSALPRFEYTWGRRRYASTLSSSSRHQTEVREFQGSDRLTNGEGAAGILHLNIFEGASLRDSDVGRYVINTKPLDSNVNILYNDREIGKQTRAVSRQRLSKHVPIATNRCATIDVLLKTMFSTRSMQRGYEEDNWGNPVSNLCGGWVEYLHRSPARRRRRRK